MVKISFENSASEDLARWLSAAPLAPRRQTHARTEKAFEAVAFWCSTLLTTQELNEWRTGGLSALTALCPFTEDEEHSMNFQGVVMNVADLNRSIDFYREVFDFTLLSQKDQLAAISAPGNDQPQVIVLRAFGSSPGRGGRHIGLRAFVLEVDSTDQLEKTAGELDSRGLLVSRRDHDEWTAIVGRDLDGVAVVVACVAGAGSRITETSWRTLDDFLYGIGE